MPQYVIEMTHSSSECVEALEEIEPRAKELLGDIYWNCMSGEHIGRVLVEADNEEQAREMVPESVRNEATVVEVQAVAPELVQAIDPEAKNPMSQEPDAS